MSTVRTRFAPSPTGFLHVGGLRTALFAYLFAKKNKGTFILRIEDTDQGRFVEGGIESMIHSLTWAGLTIDEGVTINDQGEILQNGDHETYIQSERLGFYERHLNELIEKGHAYYCFCTKERLEELRHFQELNKLPTGYDGHCRTIPPAEALKRKKTGETTVVRMKMPKEGTTSFVDLVRGEVTFANHLIDDQVLMKSDGFPTYHLASVVDDHLMEITHVIRAEEWLPSTPKHLVLYEMFGWEKPEFAHLSLLINEQKQKLSKRHGDVSVEDFKAKGYLPEALVNFVAFLGWNPGDNRELFTLKELEQEFSFEKVSKAAAVFNREKLDWYNKHAIMRLETEELVRHAKPFLKNIGLLNVDEMDQIMLNRAIDLERGRATTLIDLVEGIGFIFAETLDYETLLLVWKKSTLLETKQILSELVQFLKEISDWEKENLDQTLEAWIQNKNYAVGTVMWPLRVALSGQKNSPGPTEIAAVLGKEKTLFRVQHAMEKL